MWKTANRRIILDLIADHRNAAWDPSAVLRDRAQSRTYDGAAAARCMLRTLYDEGFSNVQTVVHRVVADRTGAAVEYTLRGRHTGVFAGIRPTGRDVVLPMVILCEIRNGRIVCADLFYDTGVLLRQFNLAL
ncbi:MAG: ester cyclase [Anaerolineales bacterium]